MVPAAWSGGSLVVPACGPAPGGAATAAPVHPYPGAPWTAGYQCVEFSERYLYDRYGVTMNASANGDQVVADYAAGYPGLFTVIKNGTPHRSPAPGDVLSLSAAAGFDSAGGGHTAVVQSSSVSGAGNGTVTVAVTDAAGATATAYLAVRVTVTVTVGAATAQATGANGNLRYAEWAWHYAANERRYPSHATSSAKLGSHDK